MRFTGTLKNDSGESFDLDVNLEPIATQVETPEVVTPPQKEVTTPLPLSYNDTRFSKSESSSSIRVPHGGTVENKSITDTGSTASIVTGNGATIKNCRVNSREAVRIGGSGNFLIDGCYLEAKGTGDDHADTIQAYSPGSKGTIKVTNSSIVAHNEAATAGFFIADNWTGDVSFENVVINGGPFGIRIHADVGGDVNVSLKNVYFVGPFGYKPFYFLNYGGGKVNIQNWENVRNATIVDGKLVPGAEITKP